MGRPVRYHRQFLADLAARVEWLERNRPADQRDTLQQAVTAFVVRVSDFPAAAHEDRRRGGVSYRVCLLADPLPYLVWYSFDESKPNGPVWILMLLHEAQDRAQFDPSRFDG